MQQLHFFFGFTGVFDETTYANVFENRKNYFAKIEKKINGDESQFFIRNRKHGQREQVWQRDGSSFQRQFGLRTSKQRRRCQSAFSLRAQEDSNLLN